MVFLKLIFFLLKKLYLKKDNNYFLSVLYIKDFFNLFVNVCGRSLRRIAFYALSTNLVIRILKFAAFSKIIFIS